jgi:hypothetical protein
MGRVAPTSGGKHAGGRGHRPRRGGPRSCLEALERAGVGRPVTVPVGPDGWAMARSRALAACDTEVLALVEDDVTVEPGRSVPDINGEAFEAWLRAPAAGPAPSR